MFRQNISRKTHYRAKYRKKEIVKLKELKKSRLSQKAKTLLAIQERPVRMIIFSILAVALISAIILSSLFLGMLLHKTGVAEVLNKVRQAKLKIIPNYLRGIKVLPKSIAIDIKHQDYQKLAYMRQIALSRNHITSDCKVYVPAVIRTNGKTVKAKIRLKGDAMDHLVRGKWSFRIEVKDNETLFGMKRFSIQHPKTRNYVCEWIAHKVMQKEEILIPRYRFMEVILNGKNYGIYAVEEHFEKRLIENNKYREGPIIKFNEDVYWAEEDSLQFSGVINAVDADFLTGPRLQSAADIDAFNMRDVLEKPEIFRQFILGKNLLESFRRGILPVDKVFDAEKLARFFALSELMSAVHGSAAWFNLRFYYNPVTSLLEPIGFDLYMGDPLTCISELFPASYMKKQPNRFYERIFSDTSFLKKYMGTLERISKKAYLDKLFDEIDPELQRNLNIIYKEFPYYLFSKDVFYLNQKRIEGLLNPVKGANAYFHRSDKESVVLEIGNILTLPAEVLGVSYMDKFFFPVEDEIILIPKECSKPIEYNLHRFLFPKNCNLSNTAAKDLKVKYKILGTNRIMYSEVFPYSVISDNFVANDFMRQSPNISDFEFLKVDEPEKKIFIKCGRWAVKRSLIIPKGYEVIAQEGTVLDLQKSARILSYSPLKFFGTEENPIVICSKDLTGQGIVVMNADGESILKNTIFRGLSNPSHAGWELTGAVTFYESDVAISCCQFLSNKSEDGLNIVRSNFSISKSFFNETAFDALDIDFSNGEISNTSFVNCGNDALDISGSVVDIRDIFVNGAGDKGLSVGEASTVTADTLEIQNAGISAASKDTSSLTINGITISGCKVGFSVYQKKPEFGSAFMTVTGLMAERIEIPYLVEKESKLKVNGKNISCISATM